MKRYTRFRIDVFKNLLAAILIAGVTDAAAFDKSNWFTDTDAAWLVHKGGYGRVSAVEPEVSLPLEMAWKKRDARSIGVTPVVADSFIFVTTRDRRLLCFNRITGDQVFRRAFKGPISGNVLIQDMKLFFQTDVPDGKVYVTEINSRRKHIERDAGPADTSPILEHNQLFLFSQRGRVTCLNTDEGYRNWHVQLEGLLEFAPVFHEPYLFIPTVKGRIYKLDAVTGSEVARLDLNHTLLGDLASNGSDLFLNLTDGRVVCVDAANLHKKWEVETNQNFFCGPAYEQETLFLASREGYLIRMSAIDGAVEWKVKLRGVSVSTPTVAGDYVFTATKNGEMAAFDKKSGERLWELRVNEGISASPLVFRDFVYYCTDRGNVYAFHPKEP